MYQNDTFSWQAMGNPDFAVVGSWISSLPSSIRLSLRKRGEEALRHYVFLSWAKAFHSGRGTAYCWPSHAYLAGKIGASQSTVKRIVKNLKDLGLLAVQRRAPLHGKNQSNLYSLGKILLASLYARVSKKTQQNHVGSKMTPYNLKKSIEAGGGSSQQTPHPPKEKIGAPPPPQTDKVVRGKKQKWTYEEQLRPDGSVSGVFRRPWRVGDPL